MSQMLLIPDPRPLDQRLGASFFRNAPKRPGVYLMKDAADNLLYVGKAKNLQQRLRNYRIANPDKMPRRHLRMLRQVARIEFQFCPGESAALKHESRLLRSLKPKYNRAGVWPGKTRFMVWRPVGQQLELGLADVPETGWQRFGPLGGSAGSIFTTLARVLWLAANPGRAATEIPAGWMTSKLRGKVIIECGANIGIIASALNSFFWDEPEGFLLWLESQFAGRIHPFERKMIEGEYEVLKEFSINTGAIKKCRKQMALL